MQMRHNYKFDSKGMQLFTPKGNPVTESHPDINYMKLGKLKQDIQEYMAFLTYGSVMEAYKQMFSDRYANITVTTLRDDLELQGVNQLVATIEYFAALEYLGEYHQATT